MRLQTEEVTTTPPRHRLPRPVPGVSPSPTPSGLPEETTPSGCGCSVSWRSASQIHESASYDHRTWRATAAFDDETLLASARLDTADARSDVPSRCIRINVSGTCGVTRRRVRFGPD